MKAVVFRVVGLILPALLLSSCYTSGYPYGYPPGGNSLYHSGGYYPPTSHGGYASGHSVTGSQPVQHYRWTHKGGRMPSKYGPQPDDHTNSHGGPSGRTQKHTPKRSARESGH